MQIENHKEEVPFAHYEDLFRKLDAAEAAERTGAKWDGNEFYVTLLGREFAISHPNYAIRALPLNRFSLITPIKFRPKKITIRPETMFTAI